VGLTKEEEGTVRRNAPPVSYLVSISRAQNAPISALFAPALFRIFAENFEHANGKRTRIWLV
jgi:hypothetical protein